MTITPFTVYFILQADAIGSTLCVAAFLSLVVTAVVFRIGLGDDEVEEEDELVEARWRKLRLKWWCAATAAFAAAATLAPSTKSLCAIILIPEIVNSQAVQKDFPELYNLAVEKLKEQLGAQKK